ncbi:hypothetical protein TP47_02385 [Xanthomonas citri pv. aurantifolii]|nr:hypothetical protein TP37_00255 [Xanthomonas citri pv. aurantifolii]AMV01076.1 hypothetical protein TP50_00235 [Xanthomonas citri pv. aurantifolii]AMV06781.1 hypothetical protein AC028_08095 [Xanthomonas citri pv. aurantifolii]ARE55044.1 hypothetical protein TP45_00830 [Xanthomonas citri pv. aurantifolii]TBW98174.1 hypothetical protein TP49_07830 [Xanthomonas citri pv. aurantifolii]
MGAACVVEGVAKPAKTGVAGEVCIPATAGTAEACAMAAPPATAARATSNAERRHSMGEVVWIMGDLHERHSELSAPAQGTQADGNSDHAATALPTLQAS